MERTLKIPKALRVSSLQSTLALSKQRVSLTKSYSPIGIQPERFNFNLK